MNENCKNHQNKKALSFCHSCKEYFCEDCLEEGADYYYCKNDSCKNAKQVETEIHAEIIQSKSSDHPKILINEKAVGFCDECIKVTSSLTISDNFFFKTSVRKGVLINEREPCEICGSVIMDLTKPLPILSFIRRTVRSFRIIKTWDLDYDALYLHRNKYISREIKMDI